MKAVPTEKNAIVVGSLSSSKELFNQATNIHGFTNVFAADCVHAKAVLKEVQTDLLIVSPEVPAIAAGELLSWYRECGFHTPAIFISKEVLAHNIVNDCCSRVIDSPVDMADLRHAVQAAMLREHETECLEGQTICNA